MGSCLSCVYVRRLRKPTSFEEYRGDWALVTGASKGIGQAFSHRLAARGLNVLLVSRSKEDLESEAKAIREQYGVEAKSVPFDCFRATLEEYKSLVEELGRDHQISILVNNVGANPVGADEPKLFLDSTIEEHDAVAVFNYQPMQRLTHLVLPAMIKRKRGRVINVSSLAGTLAAPMAAVYSGAKAHVETFSKALAVEMAGHNIVVEAVIPGKVATPGSAHRPAFDTAKATDFAEAALAQSGQYFVWAPYGVHALTLWILFLLPESVRLGLVYKMTSEAAAMQKEEAALKKTD